MKFDRLLPSLLCFALSLALPACERAAPLEHVAGTPALSSFQATGGLVANNSPIEPNAVTAVIGVRGGTVQNGEHRLIVPPRAITDDTEFNFAVDGGDYVIVDLTAKRSSDGARVGTFERPLTLLLSYKDTDVRDPRGLHITHLVDGTISGRRERQPGAVNPGRKTVSAWIYHFSKYAMEIN